MFANFLSNTLNIVIFSIICQSFLSLKYKKCSYYFACVTAIILKTVLYSFNIPQLKFIISLIISLALLFVFYKGTAFNKIFFLLIYAVCNVLSELLVLKIQTTIFSKEEVFNQYSFAFFCGIVLSSIFVWFLSNICFTYFKMVKLSRTPRYFWIALILPITTLLLLLGINDYYQISVGSNYFVFIIIGLLLSNLISNKMFYIAIKKILEENEIQQDKDKLDAKLKATQKLLQQQNLFFHNIRKQSQDMLNLIEEQKHDELKEYIQNIYNETITTYNITNTNYNILNMIINDRLYILKNNQISIHAFLENTDFAGFSNQEMEQLLSFFLDLCIHKVLSINISSRKIIINSKLNESMTILSFSYISLNNDTDYIQNIIDQKVKNLLNKKQLNYLTLYEQEIQLMTISFIFNH